MNHLSSILRIVCGLVLIVLSYSTYSRNSAHIAAGEPMQIFGHATNAAPWQMMVGFAVIALIGIFMVVLGCVSLLKSR